MTSVTGSVASTSAVPHPAFESVAPLFERLVGRGGGGGALVVRRRGETVLSLCAGSADAAGERPWTPETLAISFSTTKGVASTVLHRLAERGLLAYDEPVATYWPEFAAGGKADVKVRDLLTHRAGLSSIQAVAARAEDLLDHLAMEERLAARVVRAPTSRPAYHAITYGWLIAGLLRRVSGGAGLKDLVRAEVAEPLGLGGIHIGAPAEEPGAVAEPVGSALRQFGAVAERFAPVWTRQRLSRASVRALHIEGFHRLFEGPQPPIWTTEMPAVNGCFNAEGLARMYGALANGGADGDHRLLSAETTHEAGRVQTRSLDAVLGLRMRWRLGYHHAFGTGRHAPMAFGHYGYGGSGGWADPALGLSVGFVTNRIGSLSTPMGDLTLFRLSKQVRAAAAAEADPTD